MNDDSSRNCRDARLAGSAFQSHSIEPLPIVRGLILIFIKRHPRSTGYDLMRLISEFTGDLLHLKSGTIYSELRRMEHHGFVHSVREHSGRRRRMYELTDDGLVELQQFAHQIRVRVHCILLPLVNLINDMHV